MLKLVQEIPVTVRKHKTLEIAREIIALVKKHSDAIGMNNRSQTATDKYLSWAEELINEHENAILEREEKL